MATLHTHAESLKPHPPRILPKKWDMVFYYPDEPVVYDTPEYSHIFPSDRVALLKAGIEKAEAALAERYADPDGMLLIHSDPHCWNVYVHRG